MNKLLLKKFIIKTVFTIFKVISNIRWKLYKVLKIFALQWKQNKLLISKNYVLN